MSVHARQADVQQDHLGPECQGRRQGRRPVVGGLDRWIENSSGL
jgi:hypothetical protein